MLQKAIKNSMDATQDERMDSGQIKSWQRTSGPCEITETGILWSYDAEMWKSGEGNGSRMCTRTEIMVDNAGVGQMTSPDGLEWRSMKRLQQRKIVIVGEGYYAPPTLLMEEGTERRWRRHLTHLAHRTLLISVFLSVSKILAYTVLLVHCTVCLFTPQFALTHGGMARLSWAAWLVTYPDGLSTCIVTLPSAN